MKNLTLMNQNRGKLDRDAQVIATMGCYVPCLDFAVTMRSLVRRSISKRLQTDQSFECLKIDRASSRRGRGADWQKLKTRSNGRLE